MPNETLSEAAKKQLIKTLREEGYPTYAWLLEPFDIYLTNDPEVVGYMNPGQARIVLNELLNIDQVSTIVRHELLHEWLTHAQRTQKFDQEHPDRMTNHEIANIAADFEISNKGYTEKDKRTARRLKLGDKVLSALVTEDQYPGWEDMTFEEMYDKLTDEYTKDMKEMQKKLQPLIDKLQKMSPQELDKLIDQAQKQQQQQQDQDNNSQSSSSSSQSNSSEQEDEDKQQGSGSASGSKEDSQQDKEGKDSQGGGDGDTQEDERSKKKDKAPGGGDPSMDKKSKDLQGQTGKAEDKKAKDLQDQAGKAKDQLQDIKDKSQDIKDGQGGPFGDTQDQKAQAKLAEKVAEIQKRLGDIKKKQDALDETSAVINKEKVKAAKEKEFRNITSSLSKFRMNFQRFIKDQIEYFRGDTWNRPNKNYAGSEFIMPGKTMYAPGKIPTINVYWDVSGSFDDPAKTQGARDAIGTVNQYVKKGDIKVNVFYFADRVASTKGAAGGGTNGNAVLDHIAQTKPTNVIVITDSDVNNAGGHRLVSVPGAVWMLFYGQEAAEFAKVLRGKQQTKEYLIEY